MQGTDNLLGLLSYMGMGMGPRVGRGVIVIRMVKICVICRVVMSWMLLRWRMTINMIVILTIWK